MKKNRAKSDLQIIFTTIILSLISYGCASTPASHKTLQTLEQGVVLTKYENLEIQTNAQSNVAISDSEMERIANHIKTQLLTNKPNCFSEISDNCSEPSTLVLNIKFTKYEKGNAFARAMLAGLGQIHIDANVTIQDKTTQKILAKHEVKKTFAWGGVYGGSTRIEDLEPAFAEAIVQIVLQEDSQS